MNGNDSNTSMSEHNQDVCPKAVKAHGRNLKYASKDLKNDIEFVLEAVQENRFDLRYAPGNLRNNNKTVLEAVENDGRALCHVSKDLKKDREVVLIALYSCRYNGYSWQKEEQFKILSEEEKFKLFKENFFEEFKKEALHFAAENGFDSAIRIILRETNVLVAPTNVLVAQTNVIRAGKKYKTPLHRAAKEGHLEACRALLDIGGGVQSVSGKTPLELAKRSRRVLDSKLDDDKKDEYDKVIQLLQGVDYIVKTGVGAGNALESTFKAKRFVLQVDRSTRSITEWQRRMLMEHIQVDRRVPGTAESQGMNEV